MFFKIALGAVALAVILVIGYLVIAQARNIGNTSIMQINDSNFTSSINNTQNTIIAGFGLLALGVILMGAWALIQLWK